MDSEYTEFGVFAVFYVLFSQIGTVETEIVNEFEKCLKRSPQAGKEKLCKTKFRLIYY
jgi:hypothetical protein